MHIKTLLSLLFPNQDTAWWSLLKITGVLDMDMFLKEGTPEALMGSLNACLQKKWIRPSDKERWQVNDDHFSFDQKNKIRHAFQALKLYDEVAPTQQQYDAAFLMGSLEYEVRSRLNYLIKCWDQGVRFSRLYILSGDRPLSPEQEPLAKILNNETDMMTHIVMDAVKKGAFPGVDMIALHSPKQPTAVRATSSDTLNRWESQYGIHGITPNHDRHILLVTNQPYVAYQGALAAQKLSVQSIEPIGHRDPIDTLTDGLDALARTVYAYTSIHIWLDRIHTA